jgi:hypothetical protein
VETDSGGPVCGAPDATDELFGVDYVRRWQVDEDLGLPCAAEHAAGADECGATVSVSGGFDPGSGDYAAERRAGAGESKVSVSGRCESSTGDVFFLFVELGEHEA